MGEVIQPIDLLRISIENSAKASLYSMEVHPNVIVVDLHFIYKG